MRVMIATVTAGAGHVQAAAAVEEAWRGLRPGDEVERVDLMEWVPALQRKAYAEGYVKVVEHAPEVWGLLFRQTDDPALMRRLGRVRRMWARATNLRFVRHLRRFKPDAVVCTHFLPVEILGHLEGRGEGVFTTCVVTDFEAHALWMEQAVDLYCVAAEETRASLLARGMAGSEVEVTGIPVAAKFGQAIDGKSVRRQLGLRDDVPIVLVLGGGFGMGPVAEVLSALDRLEQAVQVVVVAGRNTALRAQLATRDYRHPVRVMGFVANMHELMWVADLVLTKPGGLTTSEALALGRPLLVLNPIPGQEAANSDFLLERGAAAKVNHMEDLGFKVGQLLGSKKLKDMARAAARLGRPDAARSVVQATVGRLQG